jgi:hypothetical protein
MLWFFSRDAESLRVETRYDNETSEYLLVLKRAEALPEIERFSDRAAFHQRLVQLENCLSRDSWVAGAGPVILPYGWPKKIVP